MVVPGTTMPATPVLPAVPMPPAAVLPELVVPSEPLLAPMPVPELPAAVPAEVCPGEVPSALLPLSLVKDESRPNDEFELLSSPDGELELAAPRFEPLAIDPEVEFALDAPRTPLEEPMPPELLGAVAEGAGADCAVLAEAGERAGDVQVDVPHVELVVAGVVMPCPVDEEVAVPELDWLLVAPVVVAPVVAAPVVDAPAGAVAAVAGAALPCTATPGAADCAIVPVAAKAITTDAATN
jgi:hypothetical protein